MSSPPPASVSFNDPNNSAQLSTTKNAESFTAGASNPSSTSSFSPTHPQPSVAGDTLSHPHSTYIILGAVLGSIVVTVAVAYIVSLWKKLRRRSKRTYVSSATGRPAGSKPLNSSVNLPGSDASTIVGMSELYRPAPAPPASSALPSGMSRREQLLIEEVQRSDST
ncbi:hypothetical protein CERSUDRAFT_94308 [Gelatoporia subvermispora B]|uniref:Uncharacterized protein n=1 Tax=Ceriporiopsis subvermispora (strain B) TaxID=914234 RepID=M2QJU0_CERS8|nr:hypothetical protein CERSUDRAFT_94308 [Gelatoporia subvermispora B]